MPRTPRGHRASVIDLASRRRERDQRKAAAAVATTATTATTREDAPGWLLRSPAYRVVDNLVPWAGLADGGSFAALLGGPVDAHLILTAFPPHALTRSFCGGPTLEQVARAITREPRKIKARVWVGGYGTPDEGISVTAVYVRFESEPADADTRDGRHPALWAWVTTRLGHEGAAPGWPEPDEIAADRVDVREPGSWWRLRWGPSRAAYARPARSGSRGPAGGS